VWIRFGCLVPCVVKSVIGAENYCRLRGRSPKNLTKLPSEGPVTCVSLRLGGWKNVWWKLQ